MAALCVAILLNDGKLEERQSGFATMADACSFAFSEAARVSNATWPTVVRARCVKVYDGDHLELSIDITTKSSPAEALMENKFEPKVSAV